MYLTEIAKEIVSSINSSSPENWGGSSGSGLVVPTSVSAKFALDPFTSAVSELDIFVIPSFVELDLTSKRKAAYPTSIRSKYVVVAVCARVRTEDGAPTYDVTSEDKATELLDLKEDLDNFLSTLAVTDAVLKGMETEPVDEVELQDAFFMMTTVLEYAAC